MHGNMCYQRSIFLLLLVAFVAKRPRWRLVCAWHRQFGPCLCGCVRARERVCGCVWVRTCMRGAEVKIIAYSLPSVCFVCVYVCICSWFSGRTNVKTRATKSFYGGTAFSGAYRWRDASTLEVASSNKIPRGLWNMPNIEFPTRPDAARNFKFSCVAVCFFGSLFALAYCFAVCERRKSLRMARSLGTANLSGWAKCCFGKTMDIFGLCRMVQLWIFVRIYTQKVVFDGKVLLSGYYWCTVIVSPTENWME